MKTKVRVKTTARSIYKGEQVHQSILKSMCPFLKILYEIYLGLKIQLHKGFGLSGAWGFTFNLKVVGLFRERCRNPPLPLSWSTDSNLSYMVKYVNEIGLPHLYLMWVMLCLKISLVLKFLSGIWKMIEFFSQLYVITVILDYPGCKLW